MHAYRFISLILGFSLVSLMAIGGTPTSVWSASTGPAQPFRYIAAIRITQTTPPNAPAETYAPKTLFMQLYPSIEASKQRSLAHMVNSEAAITSKTSDFREFTPRVNLSPSYVQEFAYIDTYSNIRKYEDNIAFPSIRISLPLPWFGGGFGGGYQGLQFGIGPNLFRF